MAVIVNFIFACPDFEPMLPKIEKKLTVAKESL